MSDSQPEICYRCRKGPPETKRELFRCNYCSLLWHTSCLSPPFNLVSGKDWMCPQHHEHLQPSKHRRSSAAVELNDEIVMFETADEVMRYGGAVYSVPAKTIEDEFIRYSRRFRRYSSNSAFYISKGNEYNSDNRDQTSIQSGTTQPDGIQMLLDAAAEAEQLSIKEDAEQKKYKAIEELISIVGEDTLIEMLSR
ncbi:hypothetical protein G6F70_007115 [Rhizopus microsporus]|nr:hypothetical protein G6F71_007182 [Rhizopus microsporus]KAG1196836.1 hypothetical protein G6F70_007115 [Rhizopus microsporus]KAG1213819.1 hypothetical protein G6F69_002488 [Rhizopus microsporus]